MADDRLVHDDQGFGEPVRLHEQGGELLAVASEGDLTSHLPWRPRGDRTARFIRPAEFGLGVGDFPRAVEDRCEALADTGFMARQRGSFGASAANRSDRARAPRHSASASARRPSSLRAWPTASWALTNASPVG